MPSNYVGNMLLLIEKAVLTDNILAVELTIDTGMNVGRKNAAFFFQEF